MHHNDLTDGPNAQRRHRTDRRIEVLRSIAKLPIMLSAALMVGLPARAAQTQLFSGGWQDGRGTALWAERFGKFSGDSLNIYEVSGVAATTPGPPQEHAEAQRLGFIGADFTYYAETSVNPRVEAHLQFRISDQGRYGVRTRLDGITLYRFLRMDEPCSSTDPTAKFHCPSFPDSDNPVYTELKTCTFGQADCGCPAIDPAKLHKVAVIARGDTFTVTLDGNSCITLEDPAPGNQLRVGRFGIYLFGVPNSLGGAILRSVGATTDPTATSNFALLYSTAGYEALETKRALVRTLNDLPSSMLDAAHSVFTVLNGTNVVLSGPLRPLNEPGTNALAETFGMQLLEADFSSLRAEGSYTLRADIATTAGVTTLTTASFEIRSHLVSTNLLDGLALQNAAARRAADEDMRRNWCFETAANTCTNDPASAGAWSVAEDGAFFADRADSGRGAVLRRVFNENNGPFSNCDPATFTSAPYHCDPLVDFHYVGEVTIISGCDAQLQFGVTPVQRWAVTLQAGAGGGCAYGGGPGAVRLHYEDASSMHIVAAQLFPAAQPFQAGHPYDVDILVVQGVVTVVVDGGVVRLDNVPGPRQPLGFALKAWASTARFRRVQAWDAKVDLRKSSDGTRIPFYEAWLNIGTVKRFSTSKPGAAPAGTAVPAGTRFGQLRQKMAVPCQYWYGSGQIPAPVDPREEADACSPFFSQYSGFHDCNNFIGEATSHGTFLAALMAVWAARAAGFSQDDRELLRRAIITNALYIEGLFQEAQETGEFAHSEMGRGGVDSNLGPWLTQEALYGESAFADLGTAVDPRLAKLACSRSILSAQWLTKREQLSDPSEASIIYVHIARCAEAQGMAGSDTYWGLASQAATNLLANLSAPEGLAHTERDTARIIPWFEGVYELARSHPEKLTSQEKTELNAIAQLLLSHLTQDHVCDDRVAPGAMCPKNGFLVLPQASGPDPIPLTNWTDMQSVPRVNRTTVLPYLNFYSVPHFAVAAADAVYLARLTGRQNLEPLASGNLNWILGLNPSVPESKSVSPTGDQPWQPASFLYNASTGFARTMDGWRTPESSSKGWLAPRELYAASPRHETWWIDPLDNGFVSIVNGHVIWDGQWDYVNSGGTPNPSGPGWRSVGWASGETFLLDDGVFIKAALLLDDWLAPVATSSSNPYNTGRLAFFDKTHVDRESTTWTFDDPDSTLYAQAGRASTDFCIGKGFSGGRFTGHYVGERIGLLCTPTTGKSFDATAADIQATGWNFSDINATPWAQIARAATGICNARNFVGGFFTGHQLNGLHGVVCLQGDVAHWFDSTDNDLQSSGQTFADIDAVPWARAARAATNICLGKEYSGGFFTGHQLNGKRGVVCLSP